MTNITASSVASLRQRTGVSMMQCKKALEEADGDEEKAIEILRKSGEAQAVKKAARDQKEGLVFMKQEGNKSGIVMLHCETDFVARNEDFQKFGNELADKLLSEGEDAVKSFAEGAMSDVVQKLGENISLGPVQVIEAPVLGTYIHLNSKIAVVIGLNEGEQEIARDVAMHAAAMNPKFKTPEEVDDASIEAEKNIWKDQLKSEGKPEEIWDKIMIGKEKKFREENALVSQEFVKEPGKTVGEHLGDSKIVEYVRVAVE